MYTHQLAQAASRHPNPLLGALLVAVAAATVAGVFSRFKKASKQARSWFCYGLVIPVMLFIGWHQLTTVTHR